MDQQQETINQVVQLKAEAYDLRSELVQQQKQFSEFVGALAGELQFDTSNGIDLGELVEAVRDLNTPKEDMVDAD